MRKKWETPVLTEMNIKVLNGTAIVFDDTTMIAVEFTESFPHAALSCELADGCEDYDPQNVL